MVVSSAVELYTTLLGWHLYNSIWTLISSAGIIAIPFIVAIVGGLLESRKGEGATGKKELIGALETRLYAMIVVVFLCATSGKFQNGKRQNICLRLRRRRQPTRPKHQRLWRFWYHLRQTSRRPGEHHGRPRGSGAYLVALLDED